MMIYPQDTRYCTYVIEPPYTERYVRWCERTVSELITHLLLDPNPTVALIWTLDHARFENQLAPVKPSHIQQINR